MNVIRKKIEELTYDPGNVRKHSNKNIDAIKASLNRFGQQIPILIDSKMIVRAGNGRLEAAKQLGWTHINVVISDLPKADLVAYSIADNRTAELAEWDMEALGLQLHALEMDLSDLGFDDIDLAGLGFENIKDSGGTNPDEEWEGMPECNQEDLTPMRQIIVSFKCEESVKEFALLINQKITGKTKSLWFPKEPIDRLMDKRYEAH